MTKNTLSGPHPLPHDKFFLGPCMCSKDPPHLHSSFEQIQHMSRSGDMKNTQPASHYVPLLAHQRNTIWVAFCWWTNEGPILPAYCERIFYAQNFELMVQLFSVFSRLEGKGFFSDTEGQIWTGQFRYKAAPGLQFKLRLD